MARNLTTVIDEILEVVPETETSLRAQINSVRDSSIFSAPEVMYLFWTELFEILVDEIGEPEEEWEFKVQLIFSGRE
jgi:hypothetical protein